MLLRRIILTILFTLLSLVIFAQRFASVTSIADNTQVSTNFWRSGTLVYQIDTEELLRITQDWAIGVAFNTISSVSADEESSYVNIRLFGAVGDGTTHPLSEFFATLGEAQVVYPLATTLTSEIDLEALKKAVNDSPSGSTILFPKGNYLIDNFTSPKLINLIGEDATISTLNNNVGIRIPFDDFRIQNLKFVGSGKATPHALNFGLSISQAKNWLVYNCTFTEFALAAFRISGTYGSIGTLSKVGGNIIGCDFFNNDTGLDLTNRGEYVNVIGGNYDNNNVAIFSASGNTSIVGVNINFNETGIHVGPGVNNGHSIIDATTLNHNTTPLLIEDTKLGYTITDCNIFTGTVHLNNSTGILFDGCLLEVDTWRFEDVTNCAILNCVQSDQLFTVTDNFNSSTASITAFADDTNGETTVTSNAHGLDDDNMVLITVTTNYNGLYKIKDVTTNTFDIETPFVADDATGTWASKSNVRWDNNRNLQVQSPSIKTANYTQTRFEDKILADGTLTITLLPASSFPDVIIVVTNVGSGTVTIDADASELINGSTTHNLTTQYESARLFSDGVQWYQF